MPVEPIKLDDIDREQLEAVAEFYGMRPEDLAAEFVRRALNQVDCAIFLDPDRPSKGPTRGH